MPRITGEYLNRKWKVGVRQPRFAEGGNFYMPLKKFPGALFDPHGYIRFETEDAYQQCPYLLHGKRLNVRQRMGISSIPGYVKVE